MRTEIRSLPIRLLGVKAIYGFGSFFRGERFHDIDLAVVLSRSTSRGLASYYELKAEIDRLAGRLGVIFDLSVFTEDELALRPLHDMHELLLLAGSDQLDAGTWSR
jgi:predicted nucleotidyltransferase